MDNIQTEIAITIDTEADNLKAARTCNEFTCENIKALNRFHNLCTFHGFIPTYLVSYEVLKCKESVKILKNIIKKGHCEIGSHLHTWTTPPFTKEDIKKKLTPADLSKDCFQDKLINLSNKIETMLEISPKTFRAGRWGFSNMNAIVLEDLGYLVDCSITPYVSWKENIGLKCSYDYRQYLPTPFFIKNTKKQKILEIPVTIFLLKEYLLNNRVINHIYYNFSQTSMLNKILRNIGLKPSWLRPFADNDLHRFKAIYLLSIKKGLDLIQMMFHSYELIQSQYSPYKNIHELYDLFEKYFVYLNNINVKGITMKDYYLKEIQRGRFIKNAVQ
ncbi:hypothetical protein ACFL02_03210 [Planctomycetota bacterium]